MAVHTLSTGFCGLLSPGEPRFDAGEPGTAATAPALTIVPIEGTDDMSDPTAGTSYRFNLTCPRCGGELEHRSSVILSPQQTQAECWCADCLVVWRIDVTLCAVDDIGSFMLADDRENSARRRASESVALDVLAVFN